jgi:hypothetical protein
MTLIISFFSGMVLGLRFKVLILIPASIIVATVTIAVGVTEGATAWSIVLMGLVVLTALEVGYLVGTAIRSFLVIAIAARRCGSVGPTPRAIRRAAH